MGLDDVKKQVILLHQDVLNLNPHDQLEAIDFLNDCFSDLRLRPLSYEDLSGEVLNLSTMNKNVFRPEAEDHFANFRFPNFYDSHNFDDVDDGAIVDSFDYDQSDNVAFYELESRKETMTTSENNVYIPADSSGPVNLVMPSKDVNNAPTNVKKSRRKQMFTRKSVRRCSPRLSEASTPTPDAPVKKQGVKCIACPEICENGIELMNHLKYHDPISLSCKVCRQTFNSLVLFCRHKDEKKCRPKVRLVCQDCGMKFKFESQYLKHLRGHRDNNCKHCSAKFSSRSLCRSHMKESHPEISVEKDLIPCKFCPMSFPRLHRLYNHYRLHHSKGKFVCTICGLFLSTKEKHKEHVLVHDTEKKWKCNICEKKFYFRNMLSNHLKIHESGKYSCVTCNVSVASQLELMAHKRDGHIVKGLEPQYECDCCKRMFLKKSALVRHMSTHSGEKEYGCKDCAKSFSTLDGLMKHRKLKTHFSRAKVVPAESKYEKVYEDKLVCETCGKQYKTFSLLKCHLRTHSGTYPCVKCNKTFTVKVNLLRHIKNHDNKRAAVCELCGDSFSSLCALRDHAMIKHSDQRPVRCTVCDKSFKRNSELNRHMRTHSSKRAYECFCGRAYKQTAHLKSHQKSAHGKGLSRAPVAPLDPINEDFGRRALLQHEIAERERRDFMTDNGNLLSLANFEDHEYRLNESFKVSYVPEDYDGHLDYGDLTAPTVSPAVDLSMVAIADMDSGIAKVVKPDNSHADPSSTIPLVNLSEHIVQEYLLNLP